MKFFYIFLLNILFCIKCFGQLATYDWSNRVSASASAKKALIDANDNIYVWINNNANTLTINSITYTTDDYYNFLIKYNSVGNVVWVRPLKPGITGMCLTKDSSSVLVSGNYISNYTNIDIGNGFTMGGSEYTAAFIYKIDGATSNTLWVKTFDPLLPVLSLPTPPVSGIYETNKGIFCTQGVKIRRLDFDGNQIWLKTITANGTDQKVDALNSFADDDGNQFYAYYSSNGNTTTVTINAVSYTTLGGNNVSKTYFSLDSSGNTNWVKTSVNFNARYVNVTKAGEVILGGTYIYNNLGGYSNHPFIPGYCNRDYNIFKANLKTGKPIWNAFSLIQDKMHLSNDGNLYITCLKQNGSIDFNVGTTTKSYKPSSTIPHLYILRINQSGEPDSIFTAATLATNGSFSTFDFYRNSQGKFIYFFQRNNIAVNFSNGNANLNTNVNAYQGLVQFTPAINYRHTTSWTGVTNKSWFSASNWSNGIPTDSSTVIIPAGAANYPNSDADFYNYSTNQYPKCGTLHVNAGVADYPLSVGVTVEGLIKNNGNMTWNYDPGYYGGSFSIWGSNNYFLGNGTITYKTGDGAGYNFVRTGNNKIIINLNAPTYTLRPTNCLAVKDFQIVRGNVDWSSTTESELYVDNSILFTPPARFLNGFIQHRIMPNVPIQMPLGNAPNLQPASITLFNTTSENYLKSSFTTTITGAAPNPATCIVNAQGISSILNGGFWTINAATPLEIGAYYNANFKLKGSTNSISADRYALLKRNNASANWQVAGTYQAAKDSAGYVVSSAVNINSFSDFAIGIADGILPLQFLFFSAQKCTANQVCLHWRTANEQNVSHFEIERSVDGKTFNKIGSTNANNQASNSYTSKDDITLLQNIGFVYYRIKQIDIDGKFTFSDVRTIKLSTKNELSIYPNPSNAIVNIDGWYKVKNIVLYDINGRKLQQWNTSLSAIDISSFARGNYILIMVLATGEVLQQKLVKQ